MSKLSFSGHESFICKQFWLKKGYDFIKKDKIFSDETTVVDLGVGKNMVSSIRFWLRAFGMTNDSDELQNIAEYIFGKNGKDPFIEDIGTAWLLHYYLVKIQRASIYNMVFNQFRKERFYFTKDQLQNFIRRECENTNSNYSVNTINSDIGVFLKNYLKPQSGKISVEDDFVGLLQELELIKHDRLSNAEGKETHWYKIDNEKRENLPFHVVFYVMLDNSSYGSSISFRELQAGINSPGLVFAMNSECMFDKIEAVTNYYPQVTFTETAGNQVMQIKPNLNKFEVLDEYYK